MSTDGALSLADQRQAILDRMHAQRRIVAEHLAPPANVHRSYPRSVTMRLLTNPPALLAGLLTMTAGTRFARSSRIIPVALLALRAAAALRARKPAAAITHIAPN